MRGRLCAVPCAIVTAQMKQIRRFITVHCSPVAAFTQACAHLHPLGLWAQPLAKAGSCPVCRCCVATVGPHWATVSNNNDHAVLRDGVGSLLLPAYADRLSFSLDLVPGAAVQCLCCSDVCSGTATRVPCSPTSGMASGFATLMDEESSSDEEGEVLPGKVALAGA